MIYSIIASCLLIAVIIVLAVDLVPIARTWTGRIHIGRYSSTEQWVASIARIGTKWLKRTPTIKVTDNTRFILLDMLKGNYARSAIQHWQEAALLLGMMEQFRHKGEDADARRQVDCFLASKFNDKGEWRDTPQHVDGAILAYAALTWLSVDHDKYRPAWDATWRMIQQHLGEDGTVMYRKAMKHYRYVDTIGFICPFLVVYGLRYNRPECIQLAVKQIQEYEKHGMLEEAFIPCHAYRITNHAPLGLYGWGRGLGWFAIGLIDAWRELPSGHEAKKVLERTVIRFARAAVGCQQERGQWNWTVTRPESRADSSATATLGWFLINAAEIEEVSDIASAAAEKAIHYLMTVTRRDGAIDFSQGDTKDIGVYSMLFDILPFAQGFSIRTAHVYLAFLDRSRR